MQNDIRFRPATAADLQAVCRMVTGPEELLFVAPRGRFPLTAEQLGQLTRARSDATVITLNDQVVGYANLYDISAGKYAFIGNVVLAPEQRGQGLGRNLVAFMLERIYRFHHLPEARISVFGDNTPALLLYASLGFTPYEVEERYDYRQQRRALLHMRRKRQL